jgi:hypothetical protein
MSAEDTSGKNELLVGSLCENNKKVQGKISENAL